MDRNHIILKPNNYFGTPTVEFWRVISIENLSMSEKENNKRYKLSRTYVCICKQNLSLVLQTTLVSSYRTTAQ